MTVSTRQKSAAVTHDRKGDLAVHKDWLAVATALVIASKAQASLFGILRHRGGKLKDEAQRRATSRGSRLGEYIYDHAPGAVHSLLNVNLGGVAVDGNPGGVRPAVNTKLNVEKANVAGNILVQKQALAENGVHGRAVQQHGLGGPKSVREDAKGVLNARNFLMDGHGARTWEGGEGGRGGGPTRPYARSVAPSEGEG